MKKNFEIITSIVKDMLLWFGAFMFLIFSRAFLLLAKMFIIILTLIITAIPIVIVCTCVYYIIKLFI